jgi:hypothetical protein
MPKQISVMRILSAISTKKCSTIAVIATFKIREAVLTNSHRPCPAELPVPNQQAAMGMLIDILP